MHQLRIISGLLGKIIISLGVTCLSFAAAFALRLEGDISWFTADPTRIYLSTSILLMLLSLRLVAGTYWGVYRSGWRYVSLDDVVRIAKAKTSATICLGALVYLLQLSSFPRSVLLIELALSLLFAAAVRIALRVVSETVSRSGRNVSGKDVVVLGAGDTGHMLVKYLLSQPAIALTPITVLDDHPRHSGAMVFTVPVKGKLSDLPFLLETTPSISAVLIAIPSLAKSKILEIEQICAAFEVPVKHLQQFADIACVDEAPMTTFSIEKMLSRDLLVPSEEAVNNLIKGKRVLITGAGGSIGSELARQVLSCQPETLTLLDASEFNLFSIERELNSKNVLARLGCVTDATFTNVIFEHDRPDVVFHAAAYKHVPLLETNPRAAFRNNILGTRNILLASAAMNVKRFIFISTDKAVDPGNVMGATKAITEALVQSMVTQHALSASTVRFGNVINSAGSVLPIFREQIRSGGPLTVTHPDVERYFMSIPEAVRLVLAAAALGDEAGLYVLDMGKRLKVVDVARKMLAMHGRRDIPIIFTGLRAGEKLTEELTSDDETTEPTPLARVRRVMKRTDASSSSTQLWQWIKRREDTYLLEPESNLKEELLQFAQPKITITPKLRAMP